MSRMLHYTSLIICFQNLDNTHLGMLSRSGREYPVIQSSLSYIANILLLPPKITNHKCYDTERTAW